MPIKHLRIKHGDTNSDGIDDYVAVLTDDFREPLIGDVYGVELCRINYIPSREDSVSRAIEIANIVMKVLSGPSKERSYDN